MESYLERYDIVLETIGPVHIGCNDRIGKKAYVAKKNQGQIQICIFDQNRFWGEIIKRGLQKKYFDLILKNNTRSLQEWLTENKISDKDIKNLVSYTLHSEDMDLFKYLKNGIELCIKDPYGLPYIPGSSLKGALRTAILSQDILKNPEKYEMIKKSIENSRYNGRKNYLSRETKQIEELAFYTLNRRPKRQDIVNDYFAGIYVGDSEPLTVDSLTLFVKADQTVKGIHHKINLVREAIKPGTMIHIPLTIDRRLCKLTVDQILEALKISEKIYRRYFLSKFKVEKQSMEPVIYLGGGAGYGTKTVMYSIMGDKSLRIVSNMLIKMTSENHNHRKDIALGVSPHVKKISFYGGKAEHVGKCRVSIIPHI